MYLSQSCWHIDWHQVPTYSRTDLSQYFWRAFGSLNKLINNYLLCYINSVHSKLWENQTCLKEIVCVYSKSEEGSRHRETFQSNFIWGWVTLWTWWKWMRNIHRQIWLPVYMVLEESWPLPPASSTPSIFLSLESDRPPQYDSLDCHLPGYEDVIVMKDADVESDVSVIPKQS